MSLPFDLPLAPLLAGYDLGLPDVPVTLYLFNQKHFKAELQGLNTPQQKIIFINNKGNVVQMGYEQIRYLVFDHYLSEPKYPHPLASYSSSVEMPAGYANFNVEFSDGIKLSGRTRTFLISDGVLHLFFEDENNKIKRMFIPLTGVRRYVMGQKLGQVLLHDKVIDQNVLNVALEKQNEYEPGIDETIVEDVPEEPVEDIPQNSPAMDFIMHADTHESVTAEEASPEDEQVQVIPTMHHVVQNNEKEGITHVVTESRGVAREQSREQVQVSDETGKTQGVKNKEQRAPNRVSIEHKEQDSSIHDKSQEQLRTVQHVENAKPEHLNVALKQKIPVHEATAIKEKNPQASSGNIRDTKPAPVPRNIQQDTSHLKQPGSQKVPARNNTTTNKITAPGTISDMEHLRHEITDYSPRKNNQPGESSFELADSKKDQFAEVWKSHTHAKGKRLGEILKEMGLLNDEDIYHALAEKLSLPFVRLRKFDFDKKSLTYLPVDMVRDFKVIPLLFEDNRLIIAMSDPTNTEVLDTLRFVSGHNIEIAIATYSDVEWAIDQYYGSFQDEEIYDTNPRENENEVQLSAREVEELGQERPIVRLVHNIFVDAIHRKASDIHIRPEKKSVDLVYRIDGTLIKIRSFNPSLLPGIVSRIKIMGRMDISERRLPQDGRAQYATVGSKVDLRISVMPTVNGESVVIRILNVDVGLKTIKDLGLSDNDYIAFNDLLHKSNGILLVTGPTGSGKSTTLYAALQEIQKQNVNIITIEDPVEYHIEHILQIQINPAIEYTFARALRNILRHDPDVIMVGEIRDQETAKIAVESALTGHLVLSTLHTNDATGTISRLLEMDIEPYLLNSSLLGVVAQRLVRKNCPYCLEEEYVEPHVRTLLGVAEDEVFYHGVGCEECNNTGFSGRMGVYELLVITDNIRQYVRKGVTADELRKIALQDGMISLTQNAMSAAKQRKTSIAEVYRIRLE